MKDHNKIILLGAGIVAILMLLYFQKNKSVPVNSTATDNSGISNAGIPTFPSAPSYNIPNIPPYQPSGGSTFNIGGGGEGNCGCNMCGTNAGGVGLLPASSQYLTQSLSNSMSNDYLKYLANAALSGTDYLPQTSALMQMISGG